MLSPALKSWRERGHRTFWWEGVLRQEEPQKHSLVHHHADIRIWIRMRMQRMSRMMMLKGNSFPLDLAGMKTHRNRFESSLILRFLRHYLLQMRMKRGGEKRMMIGMKVIQQIPGMRIVILQPMMIMMKYDDVFGTKRRRTRMLMRGMMPNVHLHPPFGSGGRRWVHPPKYPPGNRSDWWGARSDGTNLYTHWSESGILPAGGSRTGFGREFATNGLFWTNLFPAFPQETWRLMAIRFGSHRTASRKECQLRWPQRSAEAVAADQTEAGFRRWLPVLAPMQWRYRLWWDRKPWDVLEPWGQQRGSRRHFWPGDSPPFGYYREWDNWPLFPNGEHKCRRLLRWPRGTGLNQTSGLPSRRERMKPWEKSWGDWHRLPHIPVPRVSRSVDHLQIPQCFPGSSGEQPLDPSGRNCLVEIHPRMLVKILTTRHKRDRRRERFIKLGIGDKVIHGDNRGYHAPLSFFVQNKSATRHQWRDTWLTPEDQWEGKRK